MAMGRLSNRRGGAARPSSQLAVALAPRHFFYDRCNEILGSQLATMHNLRHYQRLMAGMREAIAAGRFADFRAAFYAARGLPPPA